MKDTSQSINAKGIDIKGIGSMLLLRVFLVTARNAKSIDIKGIGNPIL